MTDSPDAHGVLVDDTLDRYALPAAFRRRWGNALSKSLLPLAGTAANAAPVVNSCLDAVAQLAEVRLRERIEPEAIAERAAVERAEGLDPAPELEDSPESVELMRRALADLERASGMLALVSADGVVQSAARCAREDVDYSVHRLRQALALAKPMTEAP